MNAHPSQPLNVSPDNGTDKESQLTLELLQAIDNKDDISQRYLAQEMGVALGLANSYLKRCVKKGLIKIKTAPANRYLYYLTPHGFAEKARLTGEFLSTSLALFRQSGDVYSELFAHCQAQGHQRVAFAGLSDLTEIAFTRSLQSSLTVVAVFQPNSEQETFFSLPVVAELASLPEFDVMIMTSLEQTASLSEVLDELANEGRLLVPSLLLNMNYRNKPALEQNHEPSQN